MKRHRWKYDVTIAEDVCEKCGIARMRDPWKGGTIYVDLTKDSYFQGTSRRSTKRPDCVPKM